MTTAASIRDRGLARKVVDTASAYLRIDIIEEWMFPASTAMRYVALVFPVLLYYFQGSFLNIGQERFLFMVIGTAAAAGLQDALTGLTARLNYAQERGTLETYLVEPVPWALIPIAMNIWRSLTGLFLTFAMIAFGCLLGANVRFSAVPLVVVVLLLGVAACNAIGALAGSFLVLFKRGDPVIQLYGLAAAVLGGTLFPTNVLPGSIRWLSYLVPHFYVISACRQLLMSHPPSGGPSTSVSIGVLVLFCIFGFALSLWLFDRSLRVARRLGILSV